MHLQFILCLFILPTIVTCQDFSCVSPNSLLEGKRRIVSTVFRASNARSGYPASEARLNDDGWCSGLLATNIFDPYIEVDFGMDLILTSVITEGVPPSTADTFLFIGNRHIERYRVEVAKEDGYLRYITLSANISQPAIFPLGQSRISNHTSRESLPRPVIGQILRINPYEWSDADHVCTKLEVYGCPLQECQSESQLHSNPGVDSVTVSGSSIDYNNLFNFDDTGRYYCGPSDVGSFNITITYSSPVLLTEIGIHGRDRTFPLSNIFVTSFSLSFSEDDDNFTEYTRDTGSTEFTVSDEGRHYFGLWPPITASSIKITINDWNDQPCMSLLMLGCNHSDVLNHSIGNVDSDMAVDSTLILTTTELVAITVTITESFTTCRTVTTNLNCVPSPSPLQCNEDVGVASKDKDNTPIFVALAIVVIGLLIIVTVLIVGVILCHRYQKQRKCDTFSNLLNVTSNSAGEGSYEKQKLRLGLSITKQDSCDVESKQVNKNARLETINLQYESVGDHPQRTVTDHDYVIIPTQNKTNHLSLENSNTVITSKNDPAIIDNPAYSTGSGPPLIDNPAYTSP